MLALGTVQFGMPYGITNSSGQVPVAEVVKILDIARTLGIRTIDTAFEYGSSEQLLGHVGVQDFDVITKFPAQLPTDTDVYTWLRSSSVSSRDRLNVAKLTGILFHRPEHISVCERVEIQNVIHQLKRDGIVDGVGVSVYSPHELDAVLSVFLPDIVQLPYNAFDQRFRTSGCLDKLFNLGVEVHVRSVFLQGVLLEDLDCLPAHFQEWKNTFTAWSDICFKYENDRIAVALASVRHPAIKRIIVGVQTHFQLMEIHDAFVKSQSISVPDASIADEELILPMNWSK